MGLQGGGRQVERYGWVTGGREGENEREGEERREKIERKRECVKLYVCMSLCFLCLFKIRSVTRKREITLTG